MRKKVINLEKTGKKKKKKDSLLKAAIQTYNNCSKTVSTPMM